MDVLPEPTSLLLMLFPRWVSILVLVDVLPERCDYRQFIDRPQLVSILVLVDVLPEPHGDWNSRGHFGSFNPCFSGCPSRTDNMSILRQKCEVSILVLVDVLPEQKGSRWGSNWAMLFQSLF